MLPQQYLTLSEVCSHAGVSRATLWRRIKSGALPGPAGRARQSLFDKKAVHRALAAHRHREPMQPTGSELTSSDRRLDFAPEHLRPYLQTSRRSDGTDQVTLRFPECERPASWPDAISLPEIGDRHRYLEEHDFARAIVADAERIFLEWKNARQASSRRSASPEQRRDIVALAELYYQSEQFTKLSKARKKKNAKYIRVMIQLSESIGHPLWEEITEGQINRWLNRWEAMLPTRMEYRTLYHCLGHHAVKAGWRIDNPTHGMSWRREKPKPQNLWDLEDAELYDAGCRRLGHGPLGAIILFMWHYGQRRADVANMKWGDHIDFEDSAVHMDQSKTKSEAPFRISVTMAERLKSHRREDCPYVFANPDTGRPYTAKDFEHIFKAVEMLVATPGRKRVLMINLRHSFVCRMYVNGASPMEIAAVTGHNLATVHLIHERYIQRSYEHAVSGLRKDHAARGGAAADFDLSTELPARMQRRGPVVNRRELDPDRDRGIIAALVGQRTI